jgi:hypothetical protein
MPVSKVANVENERPQSQPDTEHYLLQIDRQTKQSFKTPDSHNTAGWMPGAI